MKSKYYIKVENDHIDLAIKYLQRGMWFEETDLHMIDMNTIETEDRNVMESVVCYFRLKSISHKVYRKPHFLEQ